MSSRRIRRGRLVKAVRLEEAKERATNYKAPENPTGLREKVCRGLISLDEAIELASDYNDNIRAWLSRRKKSNVKAPTSKPNTKKKRGRKKKKNVPAKNANE